MTNGDPKSIEEACRNGLFNGQIATERGPQSVPNKNQSSLDKAQYGSKEGVLKKGS